ncbi:hypothetical protein B296_00058061, partial [Ensete ventricosum]
PPELGALEFVGDLLVLVHAEREAAAVLAELCLEPAGVLRRRRGKMKTTKGGKVMNPTDAYRKELRKKELKRVRKTNFPRYPMINKKERKKVREVGILKKDPEAIREQIEKLEKMSK